MHLCVVRQHCLSSVRAMPAADATLQGRVPACQACTWQSSLPTSQLESRHEDLDVWECTTKTAALED